MTGLSLSVYVLSNPEKHFKPRKLMDGSVWAQMLRSITFAENGHPSPFKGRYEYLKNIYFLTITALTWSIVMGIMLLKAN